MDGSSKNKTGLVLVLIGLICVIALGLLWFFTLGTNAPIGSGWYLFSFAAGLTMIVLPCTLPLAFVIVPLSMGKGPVKGFLIAFSFGLGVTLTLSFYGILAALLGKVAIGSLGAPLEVVKNWLYFIAGTFAYLFALGEIGLIRFRMPTYTGAAPAIIQKQQDYFKALLLGLFLGNIGVGCPHPATPLILTRIASSGDVFYGWLLFFVHAAGRILPLLMLALLGIMGVNALGWLVARKDKLERATGWGMVFVAGFIIVLGLFTHDWWVFSGQHTLLEEATQERFFTGMVIDKLNLGGAPHAHGMPEGTGLFGLPLAFGNWVLVALWVIPIWWAYVRRQKEIVKLPEDEKKIEIRLAPLHAGLIAVITFVLIVFVVFILPDRYYHRSMMTMSDHHGDEEEAADEHMTDGHMDSSESMMEHMDHAAVHGEEYHEEQSVSTGLASNLTVQPASPSAGKTARLNFFVNEKPAGNPVGDLEINHEKLMHVIGVRDDMNEFFHIHPGSGLRPGTFTVDHSFIKPGTYKIWSEITRDGVNHIYGHPVVSVLGKGETSQKEVNFTRSVIADNYQVVLDGDLPPVKGREFSLEFDIHDANGKEVAVEPYLGADMHLTIIREDLSVFIHAHPEDHGHSFLRWPVVVETVRAHTDETGEPMDTHMDEHMDEQTAGESEDEHIAFRVEFPQAGTYKAFAQFRPEATSLPADEAILASFWLKVEEKPAFPLNPRTILVIVSLVAIAVLSYATKRFITVPLKAKGGDSHE